MHRESVLTVSLSHHDKRSGGEHASRRNRRTAFGATFFAGAQVIAACPTEPRSAARGVTILYVPYDPSQHTTPERASKDYRPPPNLRVPSTIFNVQSQSCVVEPSPRRAPDLTLLLLTPIVCALVACGVHKRSPIYVITFLTASDRWLMRSIESTSLSTLNRRASRE